jgi:dephospho-CoA kinase
MKKSILITGISGSGKTAVSSALREKGYFSYDIDDIPRLFTMFDKRTNQLLTNQDNSNIEQVMNMSWICNVERLQHLMSEEKNDIAFYCGNAENLTEITPFFDIVILLKADDEIIRKRLSSRISNDFGKTTEIQDWILNSKEEWENASKRMGAIVIDTNKDINQVITEILKVVSNLSYK